VTEIAKGIGAAMGASIEVQYVSGYPVTRNHPAQTEFAANIARKIVGDAAVEANAAPIMGAEDFSYMLEARPGAFIFVGNGDGAGLHHPGYDFNDAALPYGMSYWVQLAEAALAA
jgi:metal-dependent amidase/aminoacylase/carboxypeptidase family protein